MLLPFVHVTCCAVEATYDLLGALTDHARPRGAFFYRGELSGPWGMAIGAGPPSFHAVEAGACWLTVDGCAPVRLAAGDLAVQPRGAAYALTDAPATAAVPVERLRARYPAGGDGVLRVPGPGPETRLVCGGVAFDGPVPHPVVAALPDVFVVPREANEPWLAHTLAFLACEARSGRPGAAAVMGHLASVVFLQAVRAALADARGGPLAALRDPHVGPAVRALAAAPGAPWTVGALAREAGLGRSAFAARFRLAVGEAPMQHVTRWRVYHASRLLRDERATLADVAGRVGYESEAAFSRAFKRWTGRPPGETRRAATVA